MALEEKRTPYEFLARWDRDGRLQGAHFAFRTVVERNGAFFSEHPEAAQPVSLAGEQGFPLSDILGALHQSALVKIEETEAAKDAAIQERDAVISTLTARVQELEGQLASETRQKNTLESKLLRVTKCMADAGDIIND